MHQETKGIAWLKVAIKTPPFSQEARIKTGQLLGQLQEGITLSMPHSRPMPDICNNCHELRINDKDKLWRIFYRIDPDNIVILHILDKKTNKTPQKDINLCKKRLKSYDSSKIK